MDEALSTTEECGENDRKYLNAELRIKNAEGY
jgi:hypothetical protein